jgi:hypothetical protein
VRHCVLPRQAPEGHSPIILPMNSCCVYHQASCKSAITSSDRKPARRHISSTRSPIKAPSHRPRHAYPHNDDLEIFSRTLGVSTNFKAEDWKDQVDTTSFSRPQAGGMDGFKAILLQKCFHESLEHSSKSANLSSLLPPRLSCRTRKYSTSLN